MRKMNRFLQLEAGLTLFIFSWTTLVGPSNLSAQTIHVEQSGKGEGIPAGSFSPEIPSELGTVEEFHAPTAASPFVIHLQDAHANPPVQEKIQEILEYLTPLPSSPRERGEDKGGGPLLVAIEGSSGPLHPEYLNLFPEKSEINEAVVRDLASRGELSGVEEFAWEQYRGTSDNSLVTFSGAEKSELYRVNLADYRELLFKQEEIGRLLLEVRKPIDLAKSRVLSPDLRKFLHERERRKEGNYGSGIHSPGLSGYLSFLRSEAKERLGIDLESSFEQIRFPQFARIFTLERFENKINLQKSEEEKKKLIEIFQARARTEEEQMLVEAFSKFSQIPYPRHIAEELWKFSERRQISLEGSPECLKSMGIVILRSEIDAVKFFEEMEILEKWLIEKLARTDEEKRLLKTIEDFNLLKNLLNLSLTRKEHEKILSAPEKIDPKNILGRLTVIARSEGDPSAVIARARSARSNLTASGQAPQSRRLLRPSGARNDELASLITQALNFYQGAGQRDKVILENALEMARQSRKSRLVLVTGGFHTPGLTELMKERGIGYAVIRPRAEASDSENLYAKVLRDEHVSLFNKKTGLTKQEALLLKALLETAAPILWKKYRLSISETASQIVKVVQNHPVLGKRIQAEVDGSRIRLAIRPHEPLTPTLSPQGRGQGEGNAVSETAPLSHPGVYSTMRPPADGLPGVFEIELVSVGEELVIREAQPGRAEVRRGRSELRPALESPQAGLVVGNLTREGAKNQLNPIDFLFYPFKPSLHAFKAVSHILQAFTKYAELALKVFQDYLEFTVSRIFGALLGRFWHGGSVSGAFSRVKDNFYITIENIINRQSWSIPGPESRKAPPGLGPDRARGRAEMRERKEKVAGEFAEVEAGRISGENVFGGAAPTSQGEQKRRSKPEEPPWPNNPIRDFVQTLLTHPPLRFKAIHRPNQKINTDRNHTPQDKEGQSLRIKDQADQVRRQDGQKDLDRIFPPSRSQFHAFQTNPFMINNQEIFLYYLKHSRAEVRAGQSKDQSEKSFRRRHFLKISILGATGLLGLGGFIGWKWFFERPALKSGQSLRVKDVPPGNTVFLRHGGYLLIVADGSNELVSRSERGTADVILIFDPAKVRITHRVIQRGPVAVEEPDGVVILQPDAEVIDRIVVKRQTGIGFPHLEPVNPQTVRYHYSFSVHDLPLPPPFNNLKPSGVTKDKTEIIRLPSPRAEVRIGEYDATNIDQLGSLTGVLKSEWSRLADEGKGTRRPVNTKTKPAGKFILGFDPYLKGTAPIAEFLPVRPLDPEAFNFGKIKHILQIFARFNFFGKSYFMFPDANPRDNYHSLLVSEEVRPSVLEKEDIQTALLLAEYNPELKFMQNTESYTANHLHIHTRTDVFPFERLAKDKEKSLDQRDGVQISSAVDWPLSNVIFRGEDIEEIAQEASQFIEVLKKQKNIPHWTFISRRQVVVFVGNINSQPAAEIEEILGKNHKIHVLEAVGVVLLEADKGKDEVEQRLNDQKAEELFERLSEGDIARALSLKSIEPAALTALLDLSRSEVRNKIDIHRTSLEMVVTTALDKDLISHSDDYQQLLSEASKKIAETLVFVRAEVRQSPYHEQMAKRHLAGQIPFPARWLLRKLEPQEVDLDLDPSSPHRTDPVQVDRYKKATLQRFLQAKRTGEKFLALTLVAGEASRMGKGQIAKLVLQALEDDAEQFVDQDKLSDEDRGQILSLGLQTHIRNLVAIARNAENKSQSEKAADRLKHLLYDAKALAPAAKTGGKWYNLLAFNLLNVKKANDELERAGYGRPFIAGLMINEKYEKTILADLHKNNHYGLDPEKEFFIFYQPLGYAVAGTEEDVEAVIRDEEKKLQEGKLKPGDLSFKTEEEKEFARRFARRNKGKVLYELGRKAEGHGWVYPALLLKEGGIPEPPIATLKKMGVREVWLHNIDNMATIDDHWLASFGMKITEGKLVTFEFADPTEAEKGRGGGAAVVARSRFWNWLIGLTGWIPMIGPWLRKPGTVRVQMEWDIFESSAKLTGVDLAAEIARNPKSPFNNATEQLDVMEAFSRLLGPEFNQALEISDAAARDEKLRELFPRFGERMKPVPLRRVEKIQDETGTARPIVRVIFELRAWEIQEADLSRVGFIHTASAETFKQNSTELLQSNPAALMQGQFGPLKTMDNYDTPHLQNHRTAKVMLIDTNVVANRPLFHFPILPGSPSIPSDTSRAEVRQSGPRAEVRKNPDDVGQEIRVAAAQGFDPFVNTIRRLVEKEKVRGIGKLIFEATRDNVSLRKKVSGYYKELKKRIAAPNNDPWRTPFNALENIGIGEIVFAAPEMEGVSFAGGLAKVIRYLPEALAHSGMSVTIFTPLYEEEHPKEYHPAAETLLKEGIPLDGKKVIPVKVGQVTVPIGPAYDSAQRYQGVIPDDPRYQAKEMKAEVYLAEEGNLRVYLIGGLDRLYPNVDSDGKIQRAIFFSRAVLEVIRTRNVYPHVLSVHEWPAAPIIPTLMIEEAYRTDGHFKDTKFLPLIHNNGHAYQGKFFTNQKVILKGHETYVDLYPRFRLIKPGENHYPWMTHPGNHDLINLAAWVYRHVNANLYRGAAVAVSKPYAEEIESNPEYGAGLQDLLSNIAQGGRLFGISNGIDESVRERLWNWGEAARKANGLPPLMEKFNSEKYSEFAPLYKEATKLVAQKKYGLRADKEAILLSLVGRLTEQKGIQLLTEELEKILRKNPKVQILLGGPLALEEVVDKETGKKTLVGDEAALRLKEVVEQLRQKPEFHGRLAQASSEDFAKKQGKKRGEIFGFLPHEEALEIMLASDFFLMPSRFEPGGLTQLEALAAGTAIIAHNIGGIKGTLIQFDETTKKGDAFLFEGFVAARFLEATRQAIRAIQVPENRKKIISNAIFAPHNWQDRVSSYRALFQFLAEALPLYPHLEPSFKTLDQIRVKPPARRSELRLAPQTSLRGGIADEAISRLPRPFGARNDIEIFTPIETPVAEARLKERLTPSPLPLPLEGEEGKGEGVPLRIAIIVAQKISYGIYEKPLIAIIVIFQAEVYGGGGWKTEEKNLLGDSYSVVEPGAFPSEVIVRMGSLPEVTKAGNVVLKYLSEARGRFRLNIEVENSSPVEARRAELRFLEEAKSLGLTVRDEDLNFCPVQGRDLHVYSRRIIASRKHPVGLISPDSGHLGQYAPWLLRVRIPRQMDLDSVAATILMVAERLEALPNELQRVYTPEELAMGMGQDLAVLIGRLIQVGEYIATQA